MVSADGRRHQVNHFCRTLLPELWGGAAARYGSGSLTDGALEPSPGTTSRLALGKVRQASNAPALRISSHPNNLAIAGIARISAYLRPRLPGARMRITASTGITAIKPPTRSPGQPPWHARYQMRELCGKTFTFGGKSVSVSAKPMSTVTCFAIWSIPFPSVESSGLLGISTSVLYDRIDRFHLRAVPTICGERERT